MYFGFNWGQQGNIMPQVSNTTFVRCYNHKSMTWPVTPAGTWPWLSVYPPVDDFLAGRIDDEVISFIQAAPAHGWLSTYHEPQTYKTVTPGEARAIHAKMQGLVHQYAPRIRYGSIVMTGSSLAQWVVDGLDYYAIDIYESLGTGTPAARLDRNFSQLPGTSRRGVAETNSNDPAKRPAWFTGIHDWLAANSGRAMTTFWNPTGPLSGPWLPDDTATIDALNAIAQEALTEL